MEAINFNNKYKFVSYFNSVVFFLTPTPVRLESSASLRLPLPLLCCMLHRANTFDFCFQIIQKLQKHLLEFYYIFFRRNNSQRFTLQRQCATLHRR